jgi:hypothetical protein
MEEFPPVGRGEHPRDVIWVLARTFGEAKNISALDPGVPHQFYVGQFELSFRGYQRKFDNRWISRTLREYPRKFFQFGR